MRTIAIALTIGLLALTIATPLAAAKDPPPGFGRCWVVWYSYGTYADPTTGEERSIDAPGGIECVW